MKSKVGNVDLGYDFETIKPKLGLTQSPVRLHLCFIFLIPHKYPSISGLYSDFSLFSQSQMDAPVF